MTILNQKGQFVIEGVLLMIVSLAFFLTAMKTLNDSHSLSNLISGPWQRIAGLSESGVWAPPDQAAKSHPNQKYRNLTLDPSSL